MSNRTDKKHLFRDAWRDMGLPPGDLTPEYAFDKSLGRRHRFDFALVQSRIGIEVDGGVYAYGGGRHATDADREKLNIAAALHWYVFRFSPQMLKNDPAGCVELVLKAAQEEVIDGTL